MMIIVDTWLFGSPAAGKAFMLVQALTVFLALIGTALSCMSTGAPARISRTTEARPPHGDLARFQPPRPTRSTPANIDINVGRFSHPDNFVLS